MNGINLVLRDIAKTQRSEETLVRRCPKISPESIPTQTTPFYSSAFDRPTSEPCVCGKQSDTLNKIQEDWIKIQLKLIEDGMRPPIRIDPPVPLWSKRPDLNAYLLKPLFVIDPKRQYGVNVTTGACLTCNKVGFLFRKQFSAPRIIDCIDTTAFAICARHVCKKSRMIIRKSVASIRRFIEPGRISLTTNHVEECMMYIRFRPMVYFNEVTLHYLECIHIHLDNTRPKQANSFIGTVIPNQNDMKGYQTPLTNKIPGMSFSENEIQKMILDVFMEPASPP